MTIHSHILTDQKTALITVSGRFDFSRASEFQETYKKYPENQHHFILDLANAEYVDSCALGILLDLNRHSLNGNSLIIQNANQLIKDTMRALRIDTLIKVE